MKEGLMEVGFHAGRQLTLNAQTYPGLDSCLLELIQNGLDSNATTITMELNFDRRSLVIRDNGTGVSKSQFQEKLNSIAERAKGEGKLGQFGIGFFSPLGKCESFKFISSPRHNSNEGYTEYSFDCKGITGSRHVTIPNTPRNDLIHDPVEKNGVWWRTSIEIMKILKDKTVNRFELDEFVQDVAVRYGVVIRKNKVTVIVSFKKDGVHSEKSVVVPEFSGKPLDLYASTDQPDAGEVSIELFLAIRGTSGRKGQILFSKTGDVFNLSTSDFIACTNKMLNREVADALRLGVFEGRISAKKIALVSDRKRFENNDALAGLCLVLEDWFEKIGSKYIEKVREDDRDARLQEMGAMALPFATQLLKRSGYDSVVSRITSGTIGKGHKPNHSAELEEVNSLGGISPKVLTTNGISTTSRDTPKVDHPMHTPVRVYGPRGRRRAIVRNDSTGLGFTCVEFENNIVPFEFKVDSGLIEINTRHPDFEACETAGDHCIVDYHMLIAQTALDLASIESSSSFGEIQKFSFRHLQTQVFGLLNAKSIVTQASKTLKRR